MSNSLRSPASLSGHPYFFKSRSNKKRRGAFRFPAAWFGFTSYLQLEVDLAKHLYDSHSFRRGGKSPVWRGRGNGYCRDHAERTALVVADRVLEVGVIQDVEEVGTKRELHPFI